MELPQLRVYWSTAWLGTPLGGAVSVVSVVPVVPVVASELSSGRGAGLWHWQEWSQSISDSL